MAIIIIFLCWLLILTTYLLLHHSLFIIVTIFDLQPCCEGLLHGILFSLQGTRDNSIAFVLTASKRIKKANRITTEWTPYIVSACLRLYDKETLMTKRTRTKIQKSARLLKAGRTNLLPRKRPSALQWSHQDLLLTKKEMAYAGQEKRMAQFAMKNGPKTSSYPIADITCWKVTAL